MKLFQIFAVMAGLIVFAGYSNAADPKDSLASDISKEVMEETQDDIQDDLDDLEEDIAETEEKIKELELQKSGAQTPPEAETEIQREIDNLKSELDATREEMKNYIKDEVHENIDEKLEEREERLERKNGGAFVITTGITWLDRDPFRELQKKEQSLKSKEFDFDNNKTFMLGLHGYYDIENGLRIGNSLSAGYKMYQSEPYTGIVVDTLGDTSLVDSLITLRVIPACFGFICEKAFLFPYFNIFAGFMVGGGATVVLKTAELSSGNSVFINDNDSDYSYKTSVAVSPAFMWDVHLGTAVSLSKYFHIGVEGQLLFAYAHDGFGPGYTDAVSVSPGIRLRMVVGKDGNE